MDSLLEYQDADVPIVIDWFDEGETVRVKPRNQSRFDVQKDRAISILQLAHSAESQLWLLLEKLSGWMRDNASRTSAGYLTLRDAKFAFIVISRSVECDDDLEGSLSELDFQIANDPDLDVIRMNAFVLPPVSREALNSFFDRRLLLEYRGQGT
jgi:hypothetical protein